MIKLENVSKSFKDEKVLHNLSLTFMEGKVYVIKGISGCGKTTLLNILAGLDSNYEGKVLEEKKELKKLSDLEIEERRKRIGYIAQDSLLIGKLTVLENLLLIHNDENAILRHMDQLNVIELKDQYPAELSGGERQRIAIIRAILNHPKIIIADEPTASLDYTSSTRIVDVVKNISSEENIIIISTHEDCFDQIASQVINLDYGKINNIETNQPVDMKYDMFTQEKKEESLLQESSSNKKTFSMDVGYIWKRNRNKYKIKTLFSMVLILCICLLGTGIKDNIRSETLRYYSTRYPINTFEISNTGYEKLKNEIPIRKYDCYYLNQDGIRINTLPEKGDSAFSYGNCIEFGRFPESQKELLVTRGFVTQYLKTEDYKAAVNKNVILSGQEFIIAGILYNLDENEEVGIATRSCCNTLYTDEYTEAQVYVMYDAISKLNCKQNTKMFFAAVDDLYKDSATIDKLKGAEAILHWDNKMSGIISVVDELWRLFIILLVVVLIIVILFISNDITLELFYRRREFGYLQIFNVEPNRIKRFIYIEYLIKIVLAMGYAIILASICAMIIYIKYHIWIMPGIVTVLVSAVLVILYSLLVVHIPVRKFMKKDILTLIKG